jgi:hypothetical protein
MFASFRRKRTKTFRGKNGFEFLTLHTRDSAGSSKAWRSPQKSQKVRVFLSSTAAT